MFIENLPFEKSLTIPNKIAIFDLDRDLRLTYRDLFDKTATFANFLFRQKKLTMGNAYVRFLLIGFLMPYYFLPVHHWELSFYIFLQKLI